ncbi:MAG: FKBP-type peptidyl-prolyl cis-trans isomerase [Chlamydiales bacterium]|nr:FKBP-type peptidyl-prolyl cis-trans isomerase [Chlamydiales bacterium]
MVFQSFSKYVLAFGVLSVSCALFAADSKPAIVPTASAVPAAAEKKVPTKEELFSQNSIDRLSQTYGHLIQRSLNNPMIKLNPKAVMQGMQDGLDGKTSPLTEKEYEETLQLIQQYAYEDLAAKNLAEAEALMKTHAKEDGMVVTEDGKLQYKILKQGSGDVVTEETVPTINYEAKYSNGQKLGSSEQSGGPIDVKLDETIPGFKKGMLGMKTGEKRIVYIHPDLGFGKAGQLPNGLLVFEIEVTKVSPKPAADADDSDDDEDEDDDLADLLNSEDFMADADDDDDEDFDDEDSVEDDLNYSRASSNDQPVTIQK